VIDALLGFLRFWYHFVIGDDWTVAAAVALGLVATWALVRAGVTAWWLLPLVVVLSTAVSLQRHRSRG
jgi:hypothetical protein